MAIVVSRAEASPKKNSGTWARGRSGLWLSKTGSPERPVHFWAEDVEAAAEWYTDVLGTKPYFVRGRRGRRRTSSSATVDALLAKGARVYQPLTDREAGFVTAAVVDPFGNVPGLMYNPHYLSVLRHRRNG